MNTRQSYPHGEVGLSQFIYDLRQIPQSEAQSALQESRNKIMARAFEELEEIKKAEKEAGIPKQEILVDVIPVFKLDWTHKQTGKHYTIVEVGWLKEARMPVVIYYPKGDSSIAYLHPVELFLKEFI